MITNSFYLYPNVIDVYNNVEAVNILERFRQVYQRTQKVYRGSNNRLDFQIRNADQKAVDVTGTSMVFALLNNETQEQILKKDCTDLDDSSFLRGRVSVTITENELRNIEKGFYKFSLTQETRSTVDDTNYQVTNKIPMYVDSQYGAFGTLEVYGDISGEPVDSLVISEFLEIFRSAATEQLTYESSIIDAQPELTNPYSLHTLMFYTTQYQGEIFVEGSLSEGAVPKVWNRLATIVPTANTNYTNITGKYNWFRIKHQPLSGSLDKVVYRN
jgi:hypothetical protein